MKRAVVAVVLCCLLFAVPVHAWVLFIDWGSTVAVKHTWGTGATQTTKTSYIGPALGWLDNTNVVNNVIDPTARAMGHVYCVDLMNYAEDRKEFGVTPQFDTTGWLTPPGDDGLRRLDGLYRAGWMLNQFNAWATTDDKRIALNVALWEVIYGDYFQYQSGLNSAQAAHLNYLLSSYGGQTTTRVRWYDNDATGPYHQDFIEVVPEPATLLLLGGGLLGAAAMRWRRRG